MQVLWPSDLQLVMQNFLILFFLLLLGIISGKCVSAAFCMAYIQAS